MQKRNQDIIFAENEPIFIGKIIEDELRRQERSVTWLSRKIHCDRRNVYDIFSRAYIDTGLLYKICLALNTDFFAYYSRLLQLIDNQLNTPPQFAGVSRRKVESLMLASNGYDLPFMTGLCVKYYFA